MNARILIARVKEGYQVCAVFLGQKPRSWVKVYETKNACLADLLSLELANSDDVEDALVDDWDRRGAMLVYWSEADHLTLQSAGFVEQFKTPVN